MAEPEHDRHTPVVGEKRGGPILAPPPRDRRYWTMVAVFCCGFALAFLAAWYLFTHGPARSFAPTGMDPAEFQAMYPPLGRTDVAAWLDAAGQGDFPVAAELGGKLFRIGRRVEEPRALFGKYETSSYPPYTSYAFPMPDNGGAARRVILTLDEDDRVAGFLAEETALAGE